MGRKCENCGARMSPFIPRQRVGEELLCKGCVSRTAVFEPLAQTKVAAEKDHCNLCEAPPTWYVMGKNAGDWGGFFCDEHRDSVFGPSGIKYPIKTASRKVAHDSGDGETLYHCFSGDTRYVTREGIKTLAETVGTVQQVLTADLNSREGRWVDAMIHSFGEQPLMEVRLRRNQQTQVIYATPEHRWIYRSGGRKNPYSLRTTQELRSGDRLAAALPPRVDVTLHPEGVRHGIVYGDGTANNGYCNVHLWGEKDKQLLTWFEMTGEATVAPTMTPNGVAGVRVSAKMPVTYKAVPSTDDLDYLYGWLAGYFAADGNVSKQGNVKLDSADYGSLEAVQEVALRLGIATYGISTKLRQGYGDEPTLLHTVEFIGSTLTEDFFLIESHRDRFRFRDYRYERIGWVVDSVIETDRVEEVFCPRVPETESFVLEGWLHTANCPFCGAGQLTGRSDGTAECQFCGTAFTVQVQPKHNTMPQTIDGEPRQMPDMPGGPGEPGEPLDSEDQVEETEMDLDEDAEDDVNPNPFMSRRKPRKQAGSNIMDYYDVAVLRRGDEATAIEHSTNNLEEAVWHAKHLLYTSEPPYPASRSVAGVTVIHHGNGEWIWHNGGFNSSARFFGSDQYDVLDRLMGREGRKQAVSPADREIAMDDEVGQFWISSQEDGRTLDGPYPTRQRAYQVAEQHYSDRPVTVHRAPAWALAPNVPSGDPYYLTAEGSALPEDAYIKHLALKYADDRMGVLAAIRSERGLR